VRNAAALTVAAVAALAACAQQTPAALPDLSLPTLAGPEVNLRSCPTEKCVTAYVAPWCPHCRAATEGLLALRGRLKSKGMTVRFVVGQDNPAAVKSYAAAFGPDALLDPDGRMRVAGGVPHIFVSDAHGRVERDFAGVPKDGATADELADAYGLP
jgi:hypothetical protein